MRVKTGASIKIPVLMVDATDGFTEEINVTTPTIYISKNGAAEDVPHSGTWAEIDATNMPGQYTVNLDGTDTDTVGVIQGIVTEAGNRNFHFTLEVVANLESDVYGLVDTEVAAILEDTGTTLPATLATIAGYIDTEVASTLAAVDTEIGTLTTNLADLHTDVGTAIANIATVDGVVDAILEDTGTTLPATLATIAGYIDTEVAAILEDTGTTLPATLATIAGYIDTEVASTLAAVDTEIGTLTTNLATVDGIVDAIKLKTDNIPATPATEAKQDAIIGYIDTEIASVLAAVDTEVASILEDTGTTIPATLATIAGYIDTEVASTLAAVDTEIGTLTTNLATIDGIVDAILEDTGTTLPATLATIDGIVDDILVDTGTTLPATLTTISGYVDAIADDVWDELSADGIAMRTVMNALFAAGVCAMTFDGTTLTIKDIDGNAIYTMTYTNAGGTESRTKAAEL